MSAYFWFALRMIAYLLTVVIVIDILQWTITHMDWYDWKVEIILGSVAAWLMMDWFLPETNHGQYGNGNSRNQSDPRS